LSIELAAVSAAAATGTEAHSLFSAVCPADAQKSQKKAKSRRGGPERQAGRVVIHAGDRLMPPEPSFDELIRRVRIGDEQAAARLVRDFEPVVRRVIRARLRDGRARREFDSMDICQSVLAICFVRVTAGQYDLKEPDDLVKLLLTMTRNKVAEKMRWQHRLRRDSRRTVGGVEELALAGRDPTPSSVLAGKELLEQARQRLSVEERRLVELRGQDLSWEEVAASLGGTAGARRNQLARALDRVARELRLDEP
jgi:RNA polymerase sigma factor (sigma-70 family)